MTGLSHPVEDRLLRIDVATNDKLPADVLLGYLQSNAGTTRTTRVSLRLEGETSCELTRSAFR